MFQSKSASQSKLDTHLVSLTAPASFAAEQYQGLRLTLERLGRARTMQVVAVTSPGAGDGKTLTSINLAGALARGAEARVLLIDADLRRPSVSKQLALTESPAGLADILSDERVALTDVVQPMDRFHLDVITAGTPRTAIHQLLRSARFEQLIREAREKYEFVVIDTPPLLPVFDSALLAKASDGVLMVVSANQTPRKLLGEALNLLDPAKVLGIVFNRDERPLFGYYDAYYREYFPEGSQIASEA
jgi:capsular exopolysaccharide synthesis family protein